MAKFTIHDDALHLNGVRVATLDPTIWASLRDRVTLLLDGWDDEQHERDRDAAEQAGYDAGFEAGRDVGREEGMDAGYAEGRRHAAAAD